MSAKRAADDGQVRPSPKRQKTLPEPAPDLKPEAEQGLAIDRFEDQIFRFMDLPGGIYVLHVEVDLVSNMHENSATECMILQRSTHIAAFHQSIERKSQRVGKHALLVRPQHQPRTRMLRFRPSAYHTSDLPRPPLSSVPNSAQPGCPPTRSRSVLSMATSRHSSHAQTHGHLPKPRSASKRSAIPPDPSGSGCARTSWTMST
jgi:hypothetical protein